MPVMLVTMAADAGVVVVVAVGAEVADATRCLPHLLLL